MIKILILGLFLCGVSCTQKQNLAGNKIKGSSMLLEKIIQDIKSKSTKTNYKLPDYEMVTLDNKLQIIFMKDDLPYIHFKMRLNAGRRFEVKEGISEVVASLLDKGTSGFSREEILTILDDMGSSFSASAGQEFAWLQASGLARDGQDLINLFWQLLTQATFLDTELQKEKQIILAELESLPNQPSAFLDRVFSSFVYSGTVYKEESRSSVKSLKQIDLVKFYSQYYQPEGASLLVLGQYTEKLKNSVLKQFSKWKPQTSVKPRLLKNTAVFTSPITLVHKADSSQANVLIGMPVDLVAGHPDKLTVKLANFSLGYDFSSRLMERVRKQDGLTYGIYSGFSSLKDVGVFQITTSTNQGSLGKLLQATFEETTNFYNNGLTQVELDYAKLYYSNSLFRSLEKKENLMSSFLSMSGLGADPVDYFEKFSSRVQSVDLVKVNKVIKKYFNPKNMKIFILANKNSQGGESNVKNKGQFTILEQLNNFSKNFPSHKGVDIRDYKSISY